MLDTFKQNATNGMYVAHISHISPVYDPDLEIQSDLTLFVRYYLIIFNNHENYKNFLFEWNH
jgi:hypothetical protein